LYPVLFRIGSFEITSFGVLVALGIVAGLFVLKREAAARRLAPDVVDAAAMGALGGMIGAKLLYVAEHLSEPLAETLFARGGMSWFGGLVGGVGTGLVVVVRRRWPLLPVLAAAAPALAIGHAIGRVGCLLVGDDYGRPTDLPWGIAFPEGLPPTTERVHPTQLYEALPLAVFALILVRWRRGGVPDATLLGRYFVFTGALRFLIEGLRVNPRVALGLTVAQWAAAAATVGGVLLLANARARAGSRARGRPAR
jgi:phosphatidylglycerol:prolipoprotein diacylglycerol transferase